MAYTASPSAFHFEVQGNKFHVDVWSDFDELDVHLRRLDPATSKWEYVTSHVIFNESDLRGGLMAAVESFNQALEGLFPKAETALTPEQELRAMVRDGLNYNASTNKLEVK
mgnify:CR=1 FL=1